MEGLLTDRRKARFKEVLRNRTDQLTIVVDNITNGHNIAAVVRSADAFGLTTLHLVGDSSEYGRGVSLGSERWVEVLRYSDASAVIGQLRQSGYKIVVLQAPASERGDEQQATVPVGSLPFSEKLALVFGNERLGASKEFFEAADFRAHIPMFGFVESLNISVAAAICLYSSTIADATPERKVSTLTEDRQDELKLKWLKRDIRCADRLLVRDGA